MCLFFSSQIRFEEEETRQRQRTYETPATPPMQDIQVVFGKYLSGVGDTRR